MDQDVITAAEQNQPQYDAKTIKANMRRARLDSFRRNWYKFSRNKMSVVGLILVLLLILVAIFQKYVAPYPQHADVFVDFVNANKAPCREYLLGTDQYGRDVLSRIIFSFRNALVMGVCVVCVAAPIGIAVGLVAGYFNGTIFSTILMRITDVFVAVPSLILALCIAALLEPNMFNCIMALTISWWPWYARMVFSSAASMKSEYYIKSAELIGANRFHIMIKELLPNCVSSALTKVTLDMGFVILMGATLSFVGLGQQPPKPDLGTMVSNGYQLLPEIWWLTIFPAIAIMLVVLAFNLLGDGLSDLFSAEEG